jgi:hypothetical protein
LPEAAAAGAASSAKPSMTRSDEPRIDIPSL